MRSAVDATQFQWRFQQLMGALSRHQLSLQQVERAIDDAADWSAVAAETTRAIDAFVRSLTACATPVADAQSSDTGIPSDLHAALPAGFTALLTSLAAPGVTNGARRRALTRHSVATINQSMGMAATAWFELLETMAGTGMRALNPALLAALRATQPRGYDREVIELEGALATHATTRLEIENSLARAASLRCTCREVRRADGIGPAFTPSLTMTPEQQVLDAHTLGEVAISLWLDGAQFDEPAQYVGALCVESDGGTTLDIPLRITTVPAQP